MVNLQMLKAPITGILVDDSACESDDLAFCGGVQVRVPGTDVWDEFVARAVSSDWTGVEALSGLPGTVADAVRTNASAHGQSIGDTLVSVRTWDREADTQKTFPLVDVGLAEGTSKLAEELGDGSLRYEVLDASFLFRQGDITRPIEDTRLAEMLGVEPGARVRLGVVRDALVG